MKEKPLPGFTESPESKITVRENTPSEGGGFSAWAKDVPAAGTGATREEAVESLANLLTDFVKGHATRIGELEAQVRTGELEAQVRARGGDPVAYKMSTVRLTGDGEGIDAVRHAIENYASSEGEIGAAESRLFLAPDGKIGGVEFQLAIREKP